MLKINRSTPENIDYFIALALYFTIALAILNSILVSPGTVGFFHDWFIGPFPEMNEAWSKNGLYIWDSQIGDKLYGTDWIFRLILYPLSFLGGEAISKGLLLLILTLSGFGAFCLGKQLKLGSFASFTVGLLYVFSPIVFTRIVAGHLYYLIAYFLSPLIIQNFLKGKEVNHNRYFIIAGLLLSFAIIQLQFLVMISFILLVFTLIDFRRIKKSAIGLGIILSITFLITLTPLFLPQMFVERTGIPFSPTQLLSYHALASASDLAKSLRLLGYEAQPYSYLNLNAPNSMSGSYGNIIPPWIFYVDFLIPIVGFSVLLISKDKHVISLSIVSIAGLYLLKGLNPPFPNFFAFLFIHGFYIFREVWHLVFLYSFSITFLIAFFLERTTRLKLKTIPKIALSLGLIIPIVISNGYPLLLGNFAGYLQTYDLPARYHSLYNNLLSNDQYNVLVLPYINPIRYDDLKLQGSDPLVTETRTMILPTFITNSQSPTLGASLWLLSSIQENKTENLGKLLSGFGIKFVVLRKDFVSNYPDYSTQNILSSFKAKWHTPLEPILDAQKDMKIITDNTNYKVYENENNASKIFATLTSMGGLKDFNSLLFLSNDTQLSNVAVFPSISNENSFVFIDDVGEAIMSQNSFLAIGKYVQTFDASNGWTDKASSFGYDNLLASRVNDGAFTESPGSEIRLELPDQYKNKNIKVWMKTLIWQQGGNITFQIDGHEKAVSLFSSNPSFRLLKIFDGASSGSQHFTIKNVHGRNYVEGLYIEDKQRTQPLLNKPVLTTVGDRYGPNLVMNSDFSSVGDNSSMPSYWNGSLSCGIIYDCKINDTEGWNDEKSLQISTQNVYNGTWSGIHGNPIDVTPNESYEIITHMKLNNWARQSHITVQGFNETSKNWYLINQCPSGTNGPVEWSVEVCSITNPANTTKMRAVLNAGWTSLQGKEASTWFDDIYINQVKHKYDFSNTTGSNKLVVPEVENQIIDKNPSVLIPRSITTIKNFKMVSPTQWNVHISAQRTTTIGFAEPYNQGWEAKVIENGKVIDVVKAMPLYGAINAFPIRHTGDLDIVITFVPQYWYQIGLIISVITFISCMTFIIYGWTKRNKQSAYLAQ